MRQIKFRAWDKKYKEMVNDIHIAPEYDWLVLSDNDALAERDNRGRGDNDGYELMQFTGLLDKNGKEIYEGDVVRLGRYNPHTFEDRGDLKEVIWNYKMGRWSIGRGDITVAKAKTMEVVGNIYENPELLK